MYIINHLVKKPKLKMNLNICLTALAKNYINENFKKFKI